MTVYKSPLWALAGAHFCWWPLLLPGGSSLGDDQGAAGPDSAQGFVQSQPILVSAGQRRGHHWSGPRGSPSPVSALRGVARSCSLVQTRTQPMICAGATVGIVHPERDSFAAGVCAIPGFQYLHRIFSQRQCGRMVSRWGTGVCVAVRHIVALRRIPSEGEGIPPAQETSLSASACVPGSQRPEGRQAPAGRQGAVAGGGGYAGRARAYQPRAGHH